MNIHKLGWVVSFVLAGVLVFGGYTFLVVGQTEEMDDGRTAVLVSANERTKILGEMRGLLETAQGLMVAALDNDLETFETKARAVGMIAAEGESPALMAKLPLEFKTLGMSTHKAFDDLADFAATGPDPKLLLRGMSDAMLKCTACHAGYQLKIESE